MVETPPFSPHFLGNHQFPSPHDVVYHNFYVDKPNSLCYILVTSLEVLFWLKHWSIRGIPSKGKTT